MRMHTFVISVVMVVCCGCGAKSASSPSEKSKTSVKKSTEAASQNAPRQFVITVDWPGASPQELEKQVAEKIEHAIKSVSSIETVKSVIKESLCIATVAVDSKTNDQDALKQLRAALDTIPHLPPGTGEPNVAVRIPHAAPIRIFWTPPMSDSTSAGQLIRQADELRKKLLELSNVADVDVSGVPDHQVVVQIDPAKLRQFSLTFGDVQNALDQSSGTLKKTQPAIDIKKPLIDDDTKKSIERLQKLPVATRNGRAILMRDVADVRSVSLVHQAAGFNGKPAIVLQVSPRTAGQSNVLREELRKNLSGWKAALKLDGETMLAAEPDAEIKIDFPDGLTADQQKAVHSQMLSLIKKQTVSSLLLPAVDDAETTVHLIRGKQSPPRAELIRSLRQSLTPIPGVSVHVIDPDSERLHIRLLGPDFELLREWGEASRQSLQAIAGVASVRAHGLSFQREIQVKLKPSARELGITHRDLLDAGLAPVTIGQNVLLKHSGDSRNLQGRIIRTMNGMLIDLATVATMTVTTSPKQLLRHNGTRMVELDIITEAKTISNDLRKQLRQAIEKNRPKAGDGKDYRMEIGVNRRS